MPNQVADMIPINNKYPINNNLLLVVFYYIQALRDETVKADTRILICS